MSFILQLFGLTPAPFDHDNYMNWFHRQGEQAYTRFGKHVVLGGSAVIRAISPDTNIWLPGDVDTFMTFDGSPEQAVAYLMSLSQPDFILAKITLPTPWPTGDTDAETFNRSILATGTYTRADDVPMQLVLYQSNVNLTDMMDVKVLFKPGVGFTGPDLGYVQKGILKHMCAARILKYSKRGFTCQGGH